MPLVTTKEMFEKSMKEGFAVGAFNFNNMEIIQGIVDAAAEENSPVILQASSSAIKYARPIYLKKMVEAAVEETNIPIALHLDHGPDFETCKACIDAGFTSVMIDGSKYDFEENVALTKQVVDYAHSIMILQRWLFAKKHTNLRKWINKLRTILIYLQLLSAWKYVLFLIFMIKPTRHLK